MLFESLKRELKVVEDYSNPTYRALARESLKRELKVRQSPCPSSIIGRESLKRELKDRIQAANEVSGPCQESLKRELKVLAPSLLKAPPDLLWESLKRELKAITT